MHKLTRGGFSTIDRVDKTMADIQEQTQLAVEIQDQISSGPIGADLDEVRCILPDYLPCRSSHPLFLG